MFYNFGWLHKPLRFTPAMEAGIGTHVWRIEELVKLEPEPVAAKRGQYKASASQAEGNSSYDAT